MDFNAMITQVLDITGRPEKATAAGIAINAAVFMATVKANFARDVTEATIANPAPTLFTSAINLTSLTRFRKIIYCRPTTHVKPLRPISPDQVINATNGVVQSNVMWASGTSLNFVLNKLSSTFEIGYASYPPTLTIAAPTYWMLDMMESAILDLAVSRIFGSIGDTAAAKFYGDNGMGLYNAAKRDFEFSIEPHAL